MQIGEGQALRTRGRSVRLPTRCVLDEEGADPGLSPVASALKDREGENVILRLASKTLEWGLAAVGNCDVLL